MSVAFIIHHSLLPFSLGLCVCTGHAFILQLEKQRLEMARLQGEQRAGEAEAAARLAEKQRLDSEAREARRLKAMEEMVERLQFENQRAADMFHDQVT